jgi:peptidoglycan hydrolase CwlO-like protein
MKNLATAVLVLLGLCACSGPIKERVKPDLVRALPMESRIELLDAENALFAAVDGVDEAKSLVEDAQHESDQADDRIDEAKDQRKKAKKDGDANAESIAELAIVEAKARKDFLKVEAKALRGMVHVREAELDVARGRYELAKAREVKRVNLDGSEKLKVEAFEAQVERLEERVKNLQADVDGIRSGGDEQKKAWDDSRAELARATGGAQGSAFVE